MNHTTVRSNSRTSNPKRILSSWRHASIVLFGIPLDEYQWLRPGLWLQAIPASKVRYWPQSIYFWMMTQLFLREHASFYSLYFLELGMFIFLIDSLKKGPGITSAWWSYFPQNSCVVSFWFWFMAYLLLWIGETMYDYALMGFFSLIRSDWWCPKKLVYSALFLFWYRDYLEITLTMPEQKKLVGQVEEANTKWLPLGRAFQRNWNSCPRSMGWTSKGALSWKPPKSSMRECAKGYFG